MLLFHAPIIFNTCLASFHAASRAPCSCHSVSSWDRSPNFGTLGLRWWGSPGQNLSERRIFVSNFSVTCNSFREFHTLDMSWKTQPSCRVFDELHPTGPSRDGCHALQRVALFYHATHTSSTWPLHFCHQFFLDLLTWLFFNLAMRIRALFFKSASIFGLVEQVFWRMPFFTEWVTASSSEVILARPTRHSSTGTPSSGTSGSRWFSLILVHERIRRRIWRCNFSTLIVIVAETAIVSFNTLLLPLDSLPTISKNSLYTLFCSLNLDHGVLLKISISGPKVLISNFLLDTSSHHSFQSVITRSYFLLMNLHVIQFQYGLEFLRLSFS